MKRSDKKIIVIASVALVIGILLLPHAAHAIAVRGTSQPTPSTAGSSSFSLWSLLTAGIGDTVGKLVQFMFEFILLPISALMMALAGRLFDGAVQFSLNTSYIIQNSAAINQGWVTIRDICNVLFIFILIWISISTILGTGDSQTKRRLVEVIIAALLINFSMFFTKVFIDVSNIFGNWIYSAIQNLSSHHGSISAMIADSLNILRLWTAGGNATSFANITNVGKSLADPTQGAISAVVRQITVLLATYIFVYAAIMFIMRAVTLIFLLIFSPIGFVGGILPQTVEYKNQWWGELIKATTFPFVFLTMLYVSLLFIINTQSNGAYNTAAWLGQGGTIGGVDIGSMFKYVIVIMMLFICLEVSKEASGKLGHMAQGFASNLGKYATAVGGGATGLIGKYTIGAAATRFADSKLINQIVAGGGVTGRVASAMQGGLGNVGKLGFDPRATIKEFGVKAKDGGYVGMQKEAAERQEKAQRALAPEKGELTDAALQKLREVDLDVYGRHGDIGENYRATYEQYMALDGKIKAGTATEADRKSLKQKNDRLDALKSMMNDDKTLKVGGYSIEEALYRKKGDQVRSAEAAGDAKLAASLKASLRQENAAREAEKGLDVDLAKMVKGEYDPEKAGRVGKFFVRSAGTGKVIGKVVTALTAGLAKPAADQIIKDNKKIAAKMRDTMKEGDKKKKQAEISKILTELAEGETGGTLPAAATGGAAGGTTPTTPPTGGHP